MCPTATQNEVTQLLAGATVGDQAEVERLMTLVYDELHALAQRQLAREPAGHTLQPTALVHEVFLRLVDQRTVQWQGQSHFFAICAQMMRRILVDHARAKARVKRGGGKHRVELDDDALLSPRRHDDVLAVDEALDHLAKLDQRQARIVELRFFGGLTVEEVARVLDVSKRTVEGEWTMIRAWLRRELDEEQPA